MSFTRWRLAGSWNKSTSARSQRFATEKQKVSTHHARPCTHDHPVEFQRTTGLIRHGKRRTDGRFLPSVTALDPPMSFTRRHLPHWIPDGAIVFVTWRLAGSWNKTDGENRPSVLRQHLLDPRIARMAADSIRNGETKGLYALFAWVIMPDHVHMIIQPRAELSPIMRWLKGSTARRANRILGHPGHPFWQNESFDRWIRTQEEFSDLLTYVENNPVKRGLAASAEEWTWSSASPTMTDG